MKIYLDFDGTVVEHRFPDIGRYNEGCFKVIRKLQDAGHEIILNTFRADIGEEFLLDALYFLALEQEGIKIAIMSSVLDKKIHPNPWIPSQFKESEVIYIDDIALGSPLIDNTTGKGNRVNWKEIDRQFELNGVYKTKEPKP